MVWGSLIASGAIAGIAGVIYSMRTGLFSASLGPSYLFPAIAATFLGASQFVQRPNVWGTLVAYFALAFGIQGLALSSQAAAIWSQPMFVGVALIVAVALAARPRIRGYGRKFPRKQGESKSAGTDSGRRTAAPEHDQSG